jgi:hypothetical protein
MQVKDMTKDELKLLIRETVTEILDDYLEDTDQNLTIKEEVKQRLIESKKRTDQGERGISLSEVMNQLKLN